MYKIIAVKLFVLFLVINHNKAYGHQETLLAEQVVGNLWKGLPVAQDSIDSLLREAGKSERGSSSHNSSVDWASIQVDTNSLLARSEERQENELFMQNLELFLMQIIEKGQSIPGSLAEALGVIEQIY